VDAQKLAWDQSYKWARVHGSAMGITMRPGDLEIIKEEDGNES
jgi:hypothetical protein